MIYAGKLPHTAINYNFAWPVHNVASRLIYW